MHVTKWKRLTRKRLHTVWFQLYIILEKANLWRQYNMCGSQGLERKDVWIGQAQKIFTSVYHYIKYICPNAQHQEWASIYTMEFEWLRLVSVSLSIVDVPLWQRMLIMGEVIHIWGSEHMGNLCAFHSTCWECKIIKKIVFYTYTHSSESLDTWF